MSEAEQAQLDRQALEAFAINNADLERLEALLGRFNIFEAAGLCTQVQQNLLSFFSQEGDV